MNKMGLSYIVRELECDISLSDYLQDCVDPSKFIALCQACPNYQGIWSCPPYSFGPMDLWKHYAKMRLYARMLVPTTEGQDPEAGLHALTVEKEKLLDNLLELEVKIPGSMALSAGSCNFCVSCSRKDNIPCQHPEKMRYSIESLGGNVSLTASRYLGYPLLWIQDGKLPEHLMLVGALLFPSEGEVASFE